MALTLTIIKNNELQEEQHEHGPGKREGKQQKGKSDNTIRGSR
jgi:hypothetical protein